MICVIIPYWKIFTKQTHFSAQTPSLFLLFHTINTPHTWNGAHSPTAEEPVGRRQMSEDAINTKNDKNQLEDEPLPVDIYLLL